MLADPHPLSADHSTSLEYADVSPDGRLVAIGRREGGADELAITFREVASGRDLPDRLGPTRFYGLVIAPDLGSVYYTLFTPEGPRVRHHAMGTDPASDPVVFSSAASARRNEWVISRDIARPGVARPAIQSARPVTGSR